MRYLSILLAGLVVAALPGESKAQPIGFYSRGYAVNPFVYPPAYRSFQSFASPYGYRTFSNYSAYPTPFGYNQTFSTGTAMRPYVNGPFHSVYFDPFANTYRYGPGYLNTPTYTWSIAVPPPTYVNPWVNPYANPYVYP